MRATALALLLLLALGAVAQAQGTPASFVLTWSHVQDPATPAVAFSIQRCTQSGTNCSMTDLTGATSIPYTSMTYTDSTILPNLQYCYQVASVNQFGRSPYSSQFCAMLGGPPKNAPAGLSIRIVPATP